MESSWAEQRRENARLQAESLAAAKAAESAQASAYLRQFASAARAANLPTETLVVRARGGKGSARTSIQGWYLRVDQTMAVDSEGNFYLLQDHLTLKDRLRGFTPTPSDPPLVLGYGGRDGESIDLVDALTRLHPQWRSSPAR